MFKVTIPRLLKHTLKYLLKKQSCNDNKFFLNKYKYYTPVGGICHFLGSVSPQQNFKWQMDWCYSSVLQLRFFVCLFLQTKEIEALTCEDRLTQKMWREEKPLAQFWLLFKYTHTHTHTRVYTHTYMCVCIHTHTCVYTYTHMYTIHTYVYIYICVYIYIYLFIYFILFFSSSWACPM